VCWRPFDPCGEARRGLRTYRPGVIRHRRWPGGGSQTAGCWVVRRRRAIIAPERKTFAKWNAGRKTTRRIRQVRLTPPGRPYAIALPVDVAPFPHVGLLLQPSCSAPPKDPRARRRYGAAALASPSPGSGEEAA
jgi:hypothetical protein